MLKKAVQTIFDFFFPPLCAYCRSFLEKETIFCDQCRSIIVPVVSSTLFVTETKKIKVFAISDYKDPVRFLILTKKYSDIVSSRQLGQLIWDMTYLKNVSFDFIVPIPLHWTRFAKRGFNQAHEMAKRIALNSGKPALQVLKRSKKTKFQSTLKKAMREQNLKNSFVVVQKYAEHIQGKHILIVDDLLTTGATVRCAARELYKLKPASITLAVACRVV